jgi:hypothetical protein
VWRGLRRGPGPRGTGRRVRGPRSWRACLGAGATALVGRRLVWLSGGGHVADSCGTAQERRDLGRGGELLVCDRDRRLHGRLCMVAGIDRPAGRDGRDGARLRHRRAVARRPVPRLRRRPTRGPGGGAAGDGVGALVGGHFPNRHARDLPRRCRSLQRRARSAGPVSRGADRGF